MAVDMFIKIDNVPGESKDAVHSGSTDVLAWSWNLSQSGSTHVGGGGGSGKVNVSDLSFTKWVDKGSPDLIRSCCSGKHFAKAVLTVRKAGDKPLEYMTITMEEVIISSVSTGGSGGEDRLTENVTLNFAKLKFKYVEQTEKGSAGDKPEMSWDIQANKSY